MTNADFFSSLNEDNSFDDGSPFEQFSADEPEFDDPFANLGTGEALDNYTPKAIIDDFITQYPKEYEWLVQNAHENTFAEGCLEKVNSRGELSEKQLSCVQETMLRQQARNDPKAQASALKNAIANDPANRDIYIFLGNNYKIPKVHDLLGNLVQYGSFTPKQKNWIRTMMQIGLKT
jgi:hypothetical protein